MKVTLGHFGITSGSLWGMFAVTSSGPFRTLWGHFEATLFLFGVPLGHFGNNLGICGITMGIFGVALGHVGVTLGRFRVTLDDFEVN